MLSPCLPWRKLLALAERLPPAEHPGAGRAAPASGGSLGRSEPSNGLEPFRRPLAGLGERSKAVSEALRTVARHERATRPSWKTIGAGPAMRLLRAGRPARARLASADLLRPLDWVLRELGAMEVA
jgi:hypothetical protein